jgi:hypothetical protein
MRAYTTSRYVTHRYDMPLLTLQETGTLWSDTVSKEIFDSVDDTEKKRQEAINEVIYTERDFVRDLEYLRDVSMRERNLGLD